MPISAEMVAALTNGTGYFITLIKLEALDGTILRLALNTRNYTFLGELYEPCPFETSRFQMKAGVEPDNATITHVLEGLFNRLNLIGGKWQGATITAYVVDFLHPEWGYAKKHVGRVGETTTGGYSAETEFRGIIQLLSQDVGWKTSYLCRYVTGDQYCTVNVADFTYAATVTGVTNRQRFTVSFGTVNANGLTGSYYNGQTFDSGQFVGQRRDNTIDFNWSGTGPMAGMSYFDYGVEWNGKVKPRYTENYTFQAEADDNVKVWVNGSLIIDAGIGITNSAPIALTADTEYTIKVQYLQSVLEGVGNLAYIKLRWQSTSQALEIIPKTRLFAEPITTFADRWFYRGKAVWTSGNNDGLMMETADNDGNEIVLFLPMRSDIQVGDTLNLVQGDDKTLRTCYEKWGNAVNFGGEDGIPRREDIYHIPD
jgi:hypothetical protein